MPDNPHILCVGHVVVSMNHLLKEGLPPEDKKQGSVYLLKIATVICAWGENGAIAYQDQVGVVKAPSYPPDEIVDTLGAGDTFLAATIFYLSRGKSLQESIDFGCRIAGAKVGARGYDIVEKAYNQLERKPS
ncbi:unnamed protein product [Nesidiocoris tenuis]|uniref:Carbohydrate kinase PfkB domain-containing protein n=1 Tax=Nesidiocoris tenuis TaxID=355587 RepID=A0A6H5FVE6_9HEMI|nr:unnamed protein product [Nesidiocoris tenuis]